MTPSRPSPSREDRFRHALSAIANFEIPGVSGGPNNTVLTVADYARQALKEPCVCNIDSDGTQIWPDGEGAPNCPFCHGRGEVAA